jgi:hypothetical protein
MQQTSVSGSNGNNFDPIEKDHNPAARTYPKHLLVYESGAEGNSAYGIINPQDLSGYESIEKNYAELIEIFFYGGKNVYKDEHFSQELSMQIYDLLTADKNKDSSGMFIPKIGRDKLVHSQIKAYVIQNGFEKQNQVYIAAEYFFKSILPDWVVKEELKKSTYFYCHGIKDPSDINYELLEKHSPSFRNFVVSEIPLTPWIHVDISRPEQWRLRGGIDTYSTISEDDCPPGYLKFVLNGSSQSILESMVARNVLSAKDGKKSKIAGQIDYIRDGENRTFSSSTYDIKPAVFTPWNKHPDDNFASKRLEVAPVTELDSVCKELFSRYMSLH